MQFPLDYNPVSSFEENSPWVELRCVEAGRGGDGGGDGISALALDSRKELVWAGTTGGMLHAHLATDLSRVVSVFLGAGDGGPGDVRALQVSHGAVLCALQRGLAVMSRGGVKKCTLFADTIAEPRAIALNPLSDGQTCIGGASRMLAVVDWENARILRQAALRGASVVTDACWTVPPGLSSICVFGTQTGRISVCNPSNMREDHAVVAFPGAVTSVSCSGFVVAATGCSPHGGVSYMEQAVKMFDVRQMNTPLPSIPFAAGPSCSSFDEWSSEVYCNSPGSALWALSPNGVLQCFDCTQPPNYYPIAPELHLDSAQDSFTCMAVSKQGLIVLGDSGGFIHEWSASEFAQINSNSESVYDKPVAKAPGSQIDAEFSRHMNRMLANDSAIRIPRFLSEPPLSGRGTTYLSETMFKHLDRPERKLVSSHDASSYEAAFGRRPWGKCSHPIQESILSSVKKQGSIGYAQAPLGFRRNTSDGHKPFPETRKHRKESGPMRRPRKPITNGMHAVDKKANGGSSANGNDDSGDEAPDITHCNSNLLIPSGRSKYVEMDLVALEDVLGFDFLQYNSSGLFCGLENTLSNVYVNAAVQVMYFMPPLRHAMLMHSCNREECIACELGFLFHMIDLGGPGMACEAGNFTKAFSTMANADALGLLDGKISRPPSQRIENFTLYLLEQLHQDMNVDSSSTVSALFGGQCLLAGTYAESGTEFERPSRPMLHTLSYKDAQFNCFCEVVQNSLCQNQDYQRAYCEKTGNYEMMASRRRLETLPNLMLLACNTKAENAVSWWDPYQNEPKSVEQMRSPASSEELENIAQAAIARHSKLCGSLAVKISGEDVHVSELDPSDGTEYGYDLRVEGDETIGRTADTGDTSAVYDLAFVVAFVPPTEEEASSGSTNSTGHLTAYIRVPEAYKQWKRAGGANSVTRNVSNCVTNGSGESEDTWYCFNDFVIAPCSEFEEVAAFDSRWKIPCLVAYVRRDISARMEVYGSKDEENNCDVREVIGNERSNRAFGLFEDEETPGRGTKFALDCEFVMTGRDEAIIYGDGTRRVVTPAKMALGRVSVVRASGPRKGLAIIDDYVAVKEPIVDYLTRFSGLTEGDLDPSVSRFEVKPLKMVYRRLRCLVDAGCIFIGHGLKKDFRIINFVIPPKQVIDTVNLFRVGNKRRLLGLRFLTMTLLHGEIQRGTHDSIEDADAALRLYELYQRIVGEGSEENMEKMQRLKSALYSYGYLHNFQADPQQPFVVDEHIR